MVGTSPISIKDKLRKLMAEKQHLETQINGYGEILVANNNIGMHEPLIDDEGFPRNDIDIFKVRQARQQIICLQNNHKALMKLIEQLLHQLHADTRQDETEHEMTQQTADMNLNISSTDNSDDTDVDMELIKPILLIRHVDAGSPTEQASSPQNVPNYGCGPSISERETHIVLGFCYSTLFKGLRAHDRIFEFGSINSKNFNKDLSTVGSLVSHMRNQRITIKALRGNEILNISLIPRNWSGNGLLGCNIVLAE